MLVDVFSKGITGKVAEAALGKAGITVNKNAIPFDQNPPMVASGIRVGTPAVTTRGMREPEMDIDRRADRPRAADARRRPRARHGSRGSRSAVPEVPAVSGSLGRPPYADAVADVFAPDGPLARAMPGLRAARRAGRDGRAPSRASFEDGGVLLAEAGTGTGKTLAYLVPAILSRQRVLVSTGTKNLQEQIFFKDIPALREALGVPFTATYMKGRANYLCLHRLDQLNEGAGTGRPHDVFLPIIREWAARTETGDRAELEDLPEDLPFWNEVVGDRRHLPRHRVPALRRLLRHPDAPARRRLRRRHRQPPPAVRRRGGPAERVRRGDSGLQPRRSSTKRTSSRTSRRSTSAISVSNYRLEELARDVERLPSTTGGVDDRRRDRDRQGASSGSAITRARSSASSRSRTAATDRRRADEERVRATDDVAGRGARRGGDLTGALDRRRSRRSRCSQDADGSTPTTIRPRTTTLPTTVAALARRAGELRDELRFLLRAGDPDYVYFVEFRGTRHLPARVADRRLGDRARAAARPDADDRAHVGDADRRRHASTTSASGSASRRRRSPAAVGVRLRAAGDPVSAAAHARSALDRLRRWPPAARSIEILKRTAGARVRAVHELRDAARGAGDRRDGARLSDPRAGHGAAHRSC